VLLLQTYHGPPGAAVCSAATAARWPSEPAWPETATLDFFTTHYAQPTNVLLKHA
jgi:hypothetical protein